MFEADTIYAKIAYEAILVYLKSGEKLSKNEDEIPPALKLNLACFVSIHEQDEKLRGCIGTSKPKNKHLFEEIIDNAIASATKDPRFPALKEEELNNIKVSVDVLSPPKDVEDINLLKPQKHGIIVSDSEGRKALLLPKLDGIDSTEKQLEVAKEKAGIDPETPNNELTIQYFTTTTYK